MDFLQKAQSFSRLESTFGSMAATMQSTVRGDAKKSYSLAGVSSSRVAIKLTGSGDLERAVLYNYLLSEIQRLAVVSMCQEELACEGLAPHLSITESMGRSYAELDSERPDIVLLCLLRTDGFLVPVRRVLDSKIFNACVRDPF